jgi:EAL domain-containing protein (putative c-di-GMP-specific phosphodiesterase class I)
MRDLEATRVVLQALSTMGMRIAVGDFGTGDSNLSDLKRFPINTMKVDRSFIHDRSNNADCSTTLGSVIRPAHGLHLRVAAEGVETLQQLKFLRAHDCAEAQGGWLPPRGYLLLTVAGRGLILRELNRECAAYPGFITYPQRAFVGLNAASADVET